MKWLQHIWQGKGSWRDARWVAIDCETNGLNAQQDALLSVAWVPIEPPFIPLAKSGYALIQHQQPLNQSAVVHQLSQHQLAGGLALPEALLQLKEATDGAILIAHHAQFDRTVLQRAMQQCNINWQPQGWYDTLRAEQRVLERGSVALKQDSLTLARCRSRYGLLPFHGHHARSDAIACAELFLAQTYVAQGRKPLTLNAVLARGR